jgi:MraZ protein
MFRGQYFYSIDAKGRLSIPAKLRKQVGPEANDTFVITRGTGLCIDVFPLDQWLKFEEKLHSLNNFDPSDARFTRMILQHATEDTLDSQSRIMIPQTLLNYAKIEKDVMVLGVLKKIELWNPQVYEQYLKESDETYEEIAAKVMAGNE